MIKYLLGTAIAILPSTSFAKSFAVDPARTVYVRGEIGPGALDTAIAINRLASRLDKPIDVVLASPGGNVLAGLQIVSAIKQAQENGTTVRCEVPMLAASMAFYILAVCNERYALPYAMLLWHPMKDSFRNPLTADDLLYEGLQLRAQERPEIAELIKALKISPERFYYHYHHETLWSGVTLKKEAPTFLEIVDRFENVKDPFSIQDEPTPIGTPPE